jgi:tRNA (cytidine/uridine-2'-O-)-methyltransferase
MNIALFEPDIPQNVGTIIRLSACMNVVLHIIEPCGFPFSIKALRRSAMDYSDLANIEKHNSWQHFNEARKKNGLRLVLLTTKTKNNYLNFSFQKNDVLLLGRESAGVPSFVAEESDEQVTIPMNKNTRSLNVAISAAMVLGESLRQLNAMPMIDE